MRSCHRSGAVHDSVLSLCEAWFLYHGSHCLTHGLAAQNAMAHTQECDQTGSLLHLGELSIPFIPFIPFTNVKRHTKWKPAFSQVIEQQLHTSIASGHVSSKHHTLCICCLCIYCHIASRLQLSLQQISVADDCNEQTVSTEYTDR